LTTKLPEATSLSYGLLNLLLSCDASSSLPSSSPLLVHAKIYHQSSEFRLGQAAHDPFSATLSPSLPLLLSLSSSHSISLLLPSLHATPFTLILFFRMQSRSRVDRGKNPTSKAMRKKMVGIPSPAAASCLTAHQILPYCHNIIHPPAGSSHHPDARRCRHRGFRRFHPGGGGRAGRVILFCVLGCHKNHDFSAQQEGRGGDRKDLRL
jgi:hypothetical protein